MHMECRGEWLSAYLDGELRPDQLAAAEHHLAGCADCRSFLAELQQLTQRLTPYLPDAPVGLDQHVLAALPHLPIEQRATAPYVSLATGVGVGIAMAGTALLVLAAPRLVYAWRIIQKFAVILWAAGTWQQGVGQLLVTIGVLGLAALLVAGAVYGTRLLNRWGEVSL